MKNIKRILLGIAALSLIFIACEGPAGRDGFDGRDGLDAEQTVIYEFADYNFTSANDYTIEEPIPNDVFIDFTDIVQVYRSLGIDENDEEVWEQIPQTYFIEGLGTIQYTFDFSIDRVVLFLTADFDLDTLDDPLFTDDQVFRFAVIPASVSASAKLLTSSSSYEQIAKNAVVIKIK